MRLHASLTNHINAAALEDSPPKSADMGIRLVNTTLWVVKKSTTSVSWVKSIRALKAL
jgi:hypothetical protein